MQVERISIRNEEELVNHIKKKQATFYSASKTSTVIPYEKIESYLDLVGVKSFLMADLGTMPTSLEIDSKGVLYIQGPVTWKDAKAFCQSKGRNIMTSPTEELASVLSGIATSATGERCFGHGTLRDQLLEVTMINSLGEKKKLRADRPILSLFEDTSSDDRKIIEEYHQDFLKYESFKNAPFPRISVETDLVTGTEGQLGVITGAKLKTVAFEDITYLFFALPKWEENFEPHFEIFEKVQAFRDKVYSCELIDENSLTFLPKEDQIRPGHDLIFLEIDNQYFEEIYESFLSQLTLIPEDNIFEVAAPRCREFRMNIPRYIFEANARMGVTKKGTDVQVRKDNFKNLMEFYRSWTCGGIPYNLFGHFGDAHLHFNFMPKEGEVDHCQSMLESLYEQVYEWKGSPFAEHGVGLIKQKFMKSFYGPKQKKVFQMLKNKFDPDNIFFPLGYMSGESK